MMSSRVALDIESVSNERAAEWNSKKEIKAPANYKDPDKIKEYVARERLKLGSKDALSWVTGKLFSFATVDIKTGEPFFLHSLDEKELLLEITDQCSGRDVYTKSGKLFDFPFLVGRYMYNKLPVPTFLIQKSFQHDVDDFFSWSSSNPQRGSLESYAHGLGISGKHGDYKTAEKLYTAMLIGDSTPEMVEELKVYNIQDSMIVREMVQRYYGYSLDQTGQQN